MQLNLRSDLDTDLKEIAPMPHKQLNNGYEEEDDYRSVPANNSSYKHNQRTNGPVNAHLRPEIYTNKLV